MIPLRSVATSQVNLRIYKYMYVSGKEKYEVNTSIARQRLIQTTAVGACV